MIGLILRLMGTALGVCFIGWWMYWWMYISWLGIKVFFGLDNKKDNKNK